MKKLALLSLFCLGTILTFAQKSPKAEASGVISEGNVTVVYHSPSAKGRTIMGDLVPYGKIWRTGANNATTIKFEKDVNIEGKALAAGLYSLYTVPGKDEWTIVINKDTDQWGTVYTEASDVLRVKVKPGKTDKFVESFLVTVEKNGVNLAWENTSVTFGIK